MYYKAQMGGRERERREKEKRDREREESSLADPFSWLRVCQYLPAKELDMAEQ